MSLSDSSDLSSGETVYTLEDLQKLGVIDQEVADWIKKHPLPPDELLLCLEYHNQQFADRMNEISAALVQNHGQQVTSTVFQFTNRDQVIAARENIRDTHTWAFFHRGGIAVPGHLLNQPGQWVPLPQNPTISTKLINFYSEARFTVDDTYKFFEY